ncbi:hypothetical protein IAU59_006099 [Kwoniella sp. CBS 9459]
MAPPPVSIYVTSLTSQPKVRQHIDLLRRSLRGLEIPYEEHDLVIDEDAKKRWQRSKPPGMVVGLPGYLVGGEWVGTMDDFEDAVETQRLPEFLKQDLDLSATPAEPTSSTQPASSISGAPATGSSSADNNNSNTTGGGGTKTVQEVELEKLMREMSDADLDKLMGELGVEEKSLDNKIGLFDSSKNDTGSGTVNAETIGDVKETEKGLIAELKEEARLDDNEEDIVLRKATPPLHSDAEDQTPAKASETTSKNTSDSNAVVGEEGLGSGAGLEGFARSEGDVLSELKDELRVDQKEEQEIGNVVAGASKEKVD